MQLESEELVHQFQSDWPAEAEASTLRLLVAKLTEENTDLHAQVNRLTAAAQPSTYSATAPRPYVLGDADSQHV